MDTYVREVIKRLEAKLKELMPNDEFLAFIKNACDEAFRIEVEEWEDGDFKQFVLENFGEIVKREED